MSSVDDRIVEMKFDNAAFGRGVAETLRDLEKLRQNLDFANSTRSMNELSNASKNFNMHGMADAVEGVSGKFLALTTVALTSLVRITEAAITAGARIVKSLTIAPVMDGFREYETNINSIQTILANTDSKGTTLQNVNDALDQLNKYADQTIYNFSEMTRNIGTFTAAGVDLDKSVLSIKGIANIAAISGSNAEQASTAMYQLSQAMASGTVKLMDWNSVVNAGMGGEVFQKALFEAGKAAKTLTDVPVGQSFDDWKKAGNSFRGSLESGWITAEVLTNTLAGFTGDLTEAQIMSMGYTKEQAAEVMRLGKIGKSAATEVKTLTQLLGTIKEAVGSGWASSFRILFGDFEEAKKLFTGLSNVIGGAVGRSSDARNKMLQEWKDLGGRSELLQGLENAFSALGKIMGTVGRAFRDVFPATTGQRLFDLTKAFADFTDKLRPSNELLDKLRSIFGGVFAVFDIGKTIVVEFVKFLGGLLSNLSGVGSGALDLGQKLGIMVRVLQSVLVEKGGIHNFFVKLAEVIKTPIPFLKDLANSIKDFFTGFSDNAVVVEILDRLKDRFESLSKIPEIWDRLSNGLERVKDVFSGVWNYIKGWLSDLGKNIAEAFKPGDFDAAVDIVNVGFLGGLILMFKKFISGGLLNNLGGGILDKIKESFDGLTGTLKAMQANVRADTLMKIAIAVGVLTASVLLLSTVDSEALTKALVAMSVGFGQMVSVLELLTKITSGPMGAVKLAALSAGLILVAGSMVVLSVAIKNLSDLSWGELAKGLTGAGVGLGLLVVAMNLLPPPAGMISAGIAMSAIAVALILLSKAVESFADISWSEMGRGLAGIAGGLAVLIAAMHLMPSSGLVASGAGLILVATGLRILAEAVAAFGDLSWKEIGKGLVAIGGALLIIAAAMNLMPPNMVFTATGLLLLSVALNVMAKAVKELSEMKFGDMVKGLGALAGMLGILAGAMILMTGTLSGSAALLVASAALLVLSGVLKILGNMSITEIATGLGALAAVFVVLGVAGLVLAPVVPVLFSLGGAIALLGAGFALFGAGAFLVAKALEAMAAAGVVGIKALIEVIKLFIAALPEFVGAFIKSILELGKELLAAAPLILRLVQALLTQLLDTVIELTPKIAEAISVFVTQALKLIRDKFPDILETGILILKELLKGIRDNIVDIATLAVDIVVLFADTLTKNAQKIVDSAVSLLMSFLKAISDRASDIVRSGLDLLIAFLQGISDNLSRVVKSAAEVVTTFITEIGDNASKVVTAGAESLIKFLSGIVDNITKVVTTAGDVILAFVKAIADNALRVADAAAGMLVDFLNGLADAIEQRSGELREAGMRVAFAILDGMTWGFASKAREVADAAVDVARKAYNAVTDFLHLGSPSKLFKWVGEMSAEGMAVGWDRDKSIKEAAIARIEEVIAAVQKALSELPASLADMVDLNPIITPILDLTKMRLEANNIDGLMDISSIIPQVSYSQASNISSGFNSNNDVNNTGEAIRDADGNVVGYSDSSSGDIIFNQNNYSPEALSTNDIYRSTKSQITLAKKELGVI